MSRIRSHITCALGAFLIALLLSEIVLRAFFPVIQPERSQSKTPVLRYFWSAPYLIRDSHGAIRARPNLNIREVATFGQKLEFDVHYTTNNLGFIDDRDYPLPSSRTRKIAFVGDSYTAGTGAEPWVPRLAKAVSQEDPAVDIYNLGFVGTGFHHFQKILESSAAELNFNKIAILAICDDFGRLPWTPASDDQGLWFCAPDEPCPQGSPHVRLIDLAASQGEILKYAASLGVTTSSVPETQLPQGSTLRQTARSIIHHSEILTRSNMLRQRALAWQVANQDFQKRFERDLPILKEIRERFRSMPITFVHLPEKRDGLDGAYSCNIQKEIEALEITYFPALPACKILPEDYHPHDHHFTPAGYEKLARCLRKLGERAA